MRKILLLLSHGLTLLLGFALGVYALPILVQPPEPDLVAIESVLAEPLYSAQFSRDRADSDALHWGEGELRLYQDMLVFEGKLAPGPDYRLYLVSGFVETEPDFLALKADAHEVGAIKNFNGFALDNPSADLLERYDTAVVWCETFGQFITSGQYRER